MPAIREAYILVGFLFCILAGAAMSVQGVMNTRLNEGIGGMEATVFVQGSALLLCLAALMIWHNGSFTRLGEVPALYRLGGLLAPVITITVMLGMKQLRPTVAVSTILIAQLSTAALIDAFGLLGTEKTAPGWQMFAGLGLMVGGVILLKHATA